MKGKKKLFLKIFLLVISFSCLFLVPKKSEAVIATSGSAQLKTITTGDTLVFDSWTPTANILTIVMIAQRDESISATISGNNLTWTQIRDKDCGRAQCGVVVWKGTGASPSTGTTTVTITGNLKPVSGIIQQFSGVDATTPVEADNVDSHGSTDDDDMLASVTTVTSGAWAVAFGTSRGTNAFTTPGGENTISINQIAGSGGDLIRAHMWYEGPVSTPASTQLGALNDLSGASDWAEVVISIKPSRLFTQSAYRFFENIDSATATTPMVAQDTAATLSAAGDAFRLKMLLHYDGPDFPANGETWKLQFAEKSGTCDTGFSGESYSDVTAATVIAYKDNSTPADGNNTGADGDDPTHSGHTIVNENYEESNNFANAGSYIPDGADAKWDFSLKDNGATASTAYCFRVLTSGGSQLNTYSVIPQITTASSSALTFSISDNSVGFGTLSTSAARYATGDLSGSASETPAHTIIASTTASSGYVITVNGSTLACSACGGATVSAIGGTATASSAGTEQFGINLVYSGGSGTASSPYNDQTSAYTFAFDTANFPDQIASSSGTSTDTTYSVYYLGNISPTTDAGSYSTTLTYIITATF